MSIIDHMMKSIETEANKPGLPELLRMLKDAGERHKQADAGPRFSVGSLITAADHGSSHGAGEPHLVIATRKADYEFRITDPMGSPSYGTRQDTRVLWLNPNGEICAYWVESAEYVEWTGPAERPKAKRAAK